MIGKLIRSAGGVNERHNRVLAGYVLGVRDAGKSACVGARGFVSDDLDGQLAEMTSLAQAARSDATPIKHLMFSFREGEIPTPTQVEQVVDECMRVAGLPTGHQALFALHRDTQHAHIHVVLNTVDPIAERVTSVGYWYDVLAEVCVRLERKLGFSREPGRRIELLADGTLIRRAGRSTIFGPEVDGEEHSGIASVKKLARRDRVSAMLKSSRNWDEVHQRLGTYGWTYAQKGSGAIFRLHRIGLSDVMIKPSEIDAALGFGKLIERLGPFKPTSDACVQARDIEPARPELQPTALWDAFRTHRRNLQQARKQALAELRRQHRLARAKLVDDLRREDLATHGAFEDKRLEAGIRAAVKAQKLENLRARHAEERAAVYQGLRQDVDYEPWLERRIEQIPGDALAANALRAWQIRHTERVAWSHEPLRDVPAGIVHLEPLVDDGFVHYQREGVTRFTDEGARVTVGIGSSDDDVLAFLQLSHAKWDGSFHLHGDDWFIEQCARVVGVNGVRIRVVNRPEFDDFVAASRLQPARAEAPRKLTFPHGPIGSIRSLQADGSPAAATNERVDPDTDVQPPPEGRVMAARWNLARAWAVGKKGPTWGSEHDFHAAVALRATGATQDNVERTLLAMTPRGREHGSPGWAQAARNGAAAAFGSFGDKVLASIDRDKELARLLRQSMHTAVRDARMEDLRAAPCFRAAVPGEFVCGVVEHADGHCLIVRTGDELIECFVAFAEISERHRRIGMWVEIQAHDADDPAFAPAP